MLRSVVAKRKDFTIMEMTQQTFHLEYPPFSRDPITILSDKQFWQDLPANHHYETVTVPGDYATVEELEAWVAEQNKQRR
jgi:hypothetical protein